MILWSVEDRWGWDFLRQTCRLRTHVNTLTDGFRLQAYA